MSRENGELQLTLKHFRCWDNLKLNINIGSITLIKGSSGIGKTTILQAINWCLYGTMKNIAPTHDEKAKTRVILEFPYNYNQTNGILSIDRQKNPNRLLISHVDKVYEDKVAQALIEEIFGNQDIWLASCYVGQGSRNSFLTAPNAGKMELLNTIAFHEEDPAIFISKIDEQITVHDHDYKLKLNQFNSKLSNLQTMMAQIDITKALSEQQVSDFKSSIGENQTKIHELRQLKEKREIHQNLLTNLLTQLNYLQSNPTIREIPGPEPDLINLNQQYQGLELSDRTNLEKNLTKANGIISQLQRRDDLSTEIKKYDNLLLPYVNLDTSITYTIQDYHETLSRETNQRDHQKLAHSLGVLYSENAIREKIKECQTLLEIQGQLKLIQEQKQILFQIQTLEQEYLLDTTPVNIPEIFPVDIPVPDYSQYDTTNLTNNLAQLLQTQGSIQTHIQHLLKGEDILQCPQCSGSLRYQNGKLISADAPPTNKEELNNAHARRNQITSEINQIKLQIENLNRAQNKARFDYETSVQTEQRRIDVLKEKIRLMELEQQRKQFNNQRRTEKIQTLRDRLNQIDEESAKLNPIAPELKNNKVLTDKEINEIHVYIGKLSSISVITLSGVTSQHIQSCLTYQDLIQRNNQAIMNYQTFVQTLPEEFQKEPIKQVILYIEKLKAYGNKIKFYFDEQARVQQQQQALEHQIKVTEEFLSNGVDPSEEINTLIEQNKNNELALVLNDKAQQLILKHQEITTERNLLEQMNNKIADLNTLRQFAVDTECKILQQIVDSINNSIESVCTTLFDRDININLSLFKQMKTTKHIKPIANFSISYQGGTFDNINQLSGGEGDRASLALTLALNRISSCPFLMFDESLASLDLNMKEAAVRTIRENNNNTVLVIMHDGIEGIFDNVIDIDSMKSSSF